MFFGLHHYFTTCEVYPCFSRKTTLILYNMEGIVKKNIGSKNQNDSNFKLTLERVC